MIVHLEVNWTVGGLYFSPTTAVSTENNPLMYAHTHVPKQINTKELEETAVQLECHCCVILIPAVKLHRFFIYLILSSLPLQTWLLFFCLHKSSCGSKAGWAQITGDVLQIMKSILCLSVFQSPVQFLSVMPVFCLFIFTHSLV